MTMNVHNLLHLPSVVRQLGPLWVNSCFGFETAIGELLSLFHGSQRIEDQVCIYTYIYHFDTSYQRKPQGYISNIPWEQVYIMIYPAAMVTSQ